MSDVGFEVIGYLFEGTHWILWFLATLIFHTTLIASRGTLGRHICEMLNLDGNEKLSYWDYIRLLPISVLRFFTLVLVVLGLSLSLGIALFLMMNLFSLFITFEYTTIGFLKVSLILGVLVAMNLTAKGAISEVQ